MTPLAECEKSLRKQYGLTQEDLAYNYVGEWDELMEEAKPEIAAMVKDLRGRANDD